MRDAALRAGMGQAQTPKRGDGTRSCDEAQTQPMPARLPRMRRCTCCLKWKRAPGETLAYQVVRGASVYGLWAHPPRGMDARHELERVTLVPWKRGNGHDRRYERIRGGRWVDAGEADAGKHEHEEVWR